MRSKEDEVLEIGAGEVNLENTPSVFFSAWGNSSPATNLLNDLSNVVQTLSNCGRLNLELNQPEWTWDNLSHKFSYKDNVIGSQKIVFDVIKVCAASIYFLASVTKPTSAR